MERDVILKVVLITVLLMIVELAHTQTFTGKGRVRYFDSDEIPQAREEALLRSKIQAAIRSHLWVVVDYRGKTVNDINTVTDINNCKIMDKTNFDTENLSELTIEDKVEQISQPRYSFGEMEYDKYVQAVSEFKVHSYEEIEKAQNGDSKKENKKDRGLIYRSYKYIGPLGIGIFYPTCFNTLNTIEGLHKNISNAGLSVSILQTKWGNSSFTIPIDWINYDRNRVNLFSKCEGTNSGIYSLDKTSFEDGDLYIDISTISFLHAKIMKEFNFYRNNCGLAKSAYKFVPGIFIGTDIVGIDMIKYPFSYYNVKDGQIKSADDIIKANKWYTNNALCKRFFTGIQFDSPLIHIEGGYQFFRDTGENKYIQNITGTGNVDEVAIGKRIIELMKPCFYFRVKIQFNNNY